jgi:hypothetical protein
MDCFYPDSMQFDGFRKESFRVVASSESEAIKEAEIAAIVAKPHHFRVRAIARKGDTVIYRSDKP